MKKIYFEKKTLVNNEIQTSTLVYNEFIRKKI